MTLEELINSPELPSLPEAFIRLNELINQDRPLNEITKVIEHEPSMSVRALELANSAWYKRSRQIATVKDAISVIGLDTLHQLVFASSVTRVFSGVDPQLVDMTSFWNQSLQLATTAKSVCESLNMKNSVQAFTCGVVVNIGTLLIYLYDPESSNKIVTASKENPADQYIQEKNVLGYTHNEVSASLLEKWQIPQSICLPVRHYLNPMSAPVEYQQIAAILYISKNLVYSDQAQLAAHDITNKLADTFAFLNLSTDSIQSILTNANNNLNQAKSILDVS